MIGRSACQCWMHQPRQPHQPHPQHPPAPAARPMSATVAGTRRSSFVTQVSGSKEDPESGMSATARLRSGRGVEKGSEKAFQMPTVHQQRENDGSLPPRPLPPVPNSVSAAATVVQTVTDCSMQSVASPLDLPDILNSHLPPPPYSTLPAPLATLHPPVPQCVRAPPPPVPPAPPVPPGRPPLPSRRILGDVLSTTGPTSTLNRQTSVQPLVASNYLPPPPLPTAPHRYHHHHYLRQGCSRDSDADTSTSKSCFTCTGVSIRWFILLIAFIGLICATVGTVIGAAKAHGKEHLTLALLMIGVGIILLTVSGIAWRLTSTGPTWRTIFGLSDIQSSAILNGSTLESNSRRFLPRVPVPHGRNGAHHHPYGAMFYPEFQYRPPPPSYQASMQEYRLRLLLLERSSSHHQNNSLSPVSPPPTYRSSAASSLAGTLSRPSHCNTIQRPMSRPPSYRSVIDSNAVMSHPSSIYSNTAPLPSSLTTASLHPTTSQLQLHQQHQQQHHHHHHHHQQQQQQPSSYKDDINRVTIHQTTTTSQVCTSNGVNIVAISPGPGPVPGAVLVPVSSPVPTNVSVANNGTLNNSVVQILAHV